MECTREGRRRGGATDQPARGTGEPREAQREEEPGREGGGGKGKENKWEKNPKEQKKTELRKKIGQTKPRRVKKMDLRKKTGKKAQTKYITFFRV